MIELSQGLLVMEDISHRWLLYHVKDKIAIEALNYCFRLIESILQICNHLTSHSIAVVESLVPVPYDFLLILSRDRFCISTCTDENKMANTATCKEIYSNILKRISRIIKTESNEAFIQTKKAKFKPRTPNTPVRFSISSAESDRRHSL